MSETIWTQLWSEAQAQPSAPIHGRLLPGSGRAACDGAVRPTAELSAEACGDEDADVTCDACLDVIRWARGESHRVLD